MALFRANGKPMMKQIIQINITWLKIPTGRRQTSWQGSIEKQFQLSGQRGTRTRDLWISSPAP